MLDAVLGVTGLAAAAVKLADGAAAHVTGGLHGELDDVEQVHGDLRVREHPLHGRLVDGAHVDGDDPDGVAPLLRGASQPVRGVVGGAALDLAEQPLVAGQVVEAGVPPVSEQDILAGLLVAPPPGTAAAVLVNAQVSDRRDLLPEDRVRLLPERPVRGRPRHAVVPGRLRRGDPPLRDLVPAVLQQPPGDPAPRRDLRRPLGERALRAVPVPARQAPFLQEEVYFPAPVPDVPRTGHHPVVHTLGYRPA